MLLLLLLVHAVDFELDAIKIVKSNEKAYDGENQNMDALDNHMLRNIEAFLEHNLSTFKTVRSSKLGREFKDVNVLYHLLDLARNKLRDMTSSSSLKKRESRKAGEKTAENEVVEEGDGNNEK